MTRPQRRLHRVAWAVLAIALPAGVLAALAARPADPLRPAAADQRPADPAPPQEPRP